MSNPIRVNPQNPSRPATTQPLPRRLNGSRSDQIVSISFFVFISIEGCEKQSGLQMNHAVESYRCVAMREAEDLAKEAVEVGLNPI